jgi:hypothetical protein
MVFSRDMVSAVARSLFGKFCKVVDSQIILSQKVVAFPKLA